jgi:hypothetical protein
VVDPGGPLTEEQLVNLRRACEGSHGATDLNEFDGEVLHCLDEIERRRRLEATLQPSMEIEEEPQAVTVHFPPVTRGGSPAYSFRFGSDGCLHITCRMTDPTEEMHICNPVELHRYLGRAIAEARLLAVGLLADSLDPDMQPDFTPAPTETMLVITDVAHSADGTITVTADDLPRSGIEYTGHNSLDALPEKAEEKASLDKLAKDPERILADAKKRACVHANRVYSGEYAATNPPAWSWLCPDCLAHGETTQKETPPIDRERFLQALQRLDPVGAENVRRAWSRK